MNNSLRHHTLLQLLHISSLVFSAVFFSWASNTSFAAEDSFYIKKLLMPGPVHEGHAKYEKQCEKCHGDKPEALCRDCHEKIEDDIQQKLGFHGRQAINKNLDCRSCHTEHKGRTGDILNFDADTFNHTQTDFELTGQHQAVQCSACHKPNKPHREAPQACFDCHEKDDKHKGVFGKECTDCHTTKAWDDTKYDHSKTEFPLLGRHNEITCNACHPDRKYKDTPKACYSCHAINDVHNGNNGRECDKCHKEQAWDKLSFDHDKDTQFKLKGGHEKLTCNACHKKPVYQEKTSMRCVSCHINDDKHFGNNGKECDSCHSVNGWQKQTFDHTADTKFELTGKHNELTCETCHHASDKTKKIGTACIDCHKPDDVHKGQEGDNCEQCHNAKGWQEDVRFDHNLSSFPLNGMHAITSCNACHATKEFRSAQGECYACHQADDHHKKTLGTQCDTCHTPNGWKIWLFDHDAQTQFKLDGAHQEVTCAACHTSPTDTKVKQSSACIACHAKDDEHNKRFGRSCERCHVTESFKTIRMQ